MWHIEFSTRFGGRSSSLGVCWIEGNLSERLLWKTFPITLQYLHWLSYELLLMGILISLDTIKGFSNQVIGGGHFNALPA